MANKPRLPRRRWTKREIEEQSKVTPADVRAMLESRTPALRALLMAQPVEATPQGERTDREKPDG